MGNLFGRKKQSRVTEQDKAVLQLKQQRDKLKQYQKRVAQQLEREREIARQLLRDGRKERAKLLLKKKRYQEQLLDKTENQITSLETMVQNIEFAQIEMKVVEGLQIGNECLKKMHQVMSLEEVERILEETQEAVEYQRQIDELLSGSFTQEDEDTILEELNAITQQGEPGLERTFPGLSPRECCRRLSRQCPSGNLSPAVARSLPAEPRARLPLPGGLATRRPRGVCLLPDGDASVAGPWLRDAPSLCPPACHSLHLPDELVSLLSALRCPTCTCLLTSFLPRTQEQLDLPEVPSEPLPEKKPEKAPTKARPQQVDMVAAS
uniref:Charged multivesicular body protein 6 n=1 Tax=Felis catus TaxID=9685 RepID=A0ABI7ZRT6_FELCA